MRSLADGFSISAWAFEILCKLKMIKTIVFIFPLIIILMNEFGDHGGSRLKMDGGKIPKLMIINIQFCMTICFSTITLSNKQILREI